MHSGLAKMNASDLITLLERLITQRGDWLMSDDDEDDFYERRGEAMARLEWREAMAGLDES
jgi:hypothetical protein